MYDVEVAISRSAYPLRVTGVGSEVRAWDIVHAALAAWGIPVPTGLRDPSAFADHLVRHGAYTGESADAQVKIVRAE